MKDGTTHLAYKAEHIMDLSTELVMAATVHRAYQADAQTLVDSVMEAQINSQVSRYREADNAATTEVVADKGYHKAATNELAQDLGLRTYIPEPQRRHRLRWSGKPAEQREAVYANRRRVRGRPLHRWRSERVERSFAHVCKTGGGHQCWLQGLIQVVKRYLIPVAAHNLSVLLRWMTGVGTPRSLRVGFLPSFLFTYLATLSVWRRHTDCHMLVTYSRAQIAAHCRRPSSFASAA
jgi:hypothetical protein